LKQSVGRHVQQILWSAIASTYTGIVSSIIKYGRGSDDHWLHFQNQLTKWLGWVDLTSASTLRYRALPEPTIIPDNTTDLVTIAHENPWYMDHRLLSQRIIESRAATIRMIEEGSLNRNSQKIWELHRDHGDKVVPAYRLERRRREAISSTMNTAEQIQLSIPHIGDHFPIAGYFTRKDDRVRCAHLPMHGFLALRSWKHWGIIVPPAGFGCRCWIRQFARFECIDKGWISKEGKPKFEVKWPNTLARLNFEKGVFPEFKFERPWVYPNESNSN